MSRLFLTLSFIAISLLGFSQLQNLPFTEDFSEQTLPNGWTETGTWDFDTQGELFTTQTNGYIYGTIQWGFNGETKELLTPFIDVSSVSGTLRFRMEQSFRQDFESFCDILITKDGGNTWDTLQHVAPSIYSQINEDITSYVSGADSIQIRFSFGFTGMPSGSGSSLLRWAFDDLSIKEDVAIDVAVININTPNSGCESSDSVNITIKNMGTDIITAPFTVSYSTDGINWIDEQITQNISPNYTLDYTFTTPISLTANLTSIYAKVTVTNDEENSNDEISKTINITPSIQNFPYTQDFETNNGDFFADNTNNGTWEWGTPNSNNLVGGANGSSKAWATNLTGYYGQNETSYLYTPCFDFSSLNNPVIELDLWYQLDGNMYGVYSGLLLEYSLDNGQTWNTLGTNYDGGLNWYDNQYGWYGINNDWKHAVHSMTELANEPKVKFRFSFVGINNQQEGVAIDNIFIHDAFANDLAVTAINSPTSDCSLSDETVNITVNNLGSADISSFDIAYSTDGGTSWTTETINQSIPAGQSANIDFAQNIDLSATNVYTLQAKVILTDDENPGNDEISTTVVNQPVLSGNEIFEDFENSSTSQYWILDQAWNSSTNDWELATPATANISGAYSGTNAWVTNANGNFIAEQDAYVVSPCIDLSDIPNPAIEFYLNNQGSISSNFSVEYSTDGGENWTALDAQPEDNPFWFHSPYTSFSLTTDGYEVKLRTLVTLDIMNNPTNVKFRFKFHAGSGNVAEGCAFDDFKIYQDDTLATITDVSQIQNNNLINIYPNPVKNTLFLEIDDTKNIAENTLTIYDVYGRIVKQIIIENKKLKFDVSKLQNGVYFIRLGDKVKRFIKD